MARKKKPPTPRPGQAWRVTVAVVVTLAAVAGIVFALGQLGDEALLRVGARDRYRTPFADTICDTPPGLDRPAFLSEVRYVGGLHETISAVDPAEHGRVAAAFAKHPWVEAVGGVTAEPGGVVRVALRFRMPVLAVTTADRTPRLLDRGGVLLPVAPTPPGVAELAGTVPVPTVAAGEVWRDPGVSAALRLVETYTPTRLERTATGWRLTGRDGRLYDVRN
ncbi:hypothetical protein J0H58_05420 [bacterium]|nr:hypothetical protein [bacterium]